MSCSAIIFFNKTINVVNQRTPLLNIMFSLEHYLLFAYLLTEWNSCCSVFLSAVWYDAVKITRTDNRGETIAFKSAAGSVECLVSSDGLSWHIDVLDISISVPQFQYRNFRYTQQQIYIPTYYSEKFIYRKVAFEIWGKRSYWTKLSTRNTTILNSVTLRSVQSGFSGTCIVSHGYFQRI